MVLITYAHDAFKTSFFGGLKMKTQTLNRFLSLVISLAMVVTQVIPAGLAAGPLSEPTEPQAEQTVAAAEANVLPTSVITGVPRTYEDFLSGGALQAGNPGDAESEDEDTLTAEEEEAAREAEEKAAQVENAVAAYYAELEKLDGIKSGIAASGITLDDVTAFLDVQANLKGLIEDIRDLGVEPPDELIEGFHSTVAAFDEIIGNRPLVIETEEGTVEVSASELMRIVNEEFKRLQDVKTTELDRLPGIDGADLEGLQDFKAYLESRSLNGSIGISIFKGLSAVGNLYLVERLVRKYVASYGEAVIASDRDNDGLREINFDVFRRAVNGTEAAYREAMSRIETIIEERGLVRPSGAIESLEDLVRIVTDVESLDAALRESLAALAGELTLEEAFVRQLESEVARAIQNTYNDFKHAILASLQNDTNPVSKLWNDSGLQIGANAAATFEGLRDLAVRLDELTQTMTAAGVEFDASFDGSSSLIAAVSQKLSDEKSRISNDLTLALVNAISYGDTEIESVIEELAPEFPAGDVAVDDIYSIIAQMDVLHDTLTERILAFKDSLSVSSELKQTVLGALEMRTNGTTSVLYAVLNRSHTSPQPVTALYKQIHDRFTAFLQNATVVFMIEGVGEVRLTPQDLNAIKVPAEIESLLRFPGNPVSEEDLAAMEQVGREKARRTIDFGIQGPGYVTPLPTYEYALSSAAVRFQYTGAVLEAYGSEVVQNGNISHDNYSAYRRSLLMNEALERYFDGAVAVIDGSMTRAQELIGDASRGITPETYGRLFELIQVTHESAVEILKLSLDGVIYEARQMVTAMLQDKFNELLAVVDAVTRPSADHPVNVILTIDGREVTVDARQLHEHMLEVLKRVAVSPDDSFRRSQYERLNGVGDMSSLLSPYERDQYRQISFDSRNATFSRSDSQPVAMQEIWFVLIPRIAAELGESLLDENGAVDLNAFEEALVEGVGAPVGPGESIREEMKQILKDLVEQTLAEINALDFRRLEDRLRAEEIVVQAILELEARGQDLVQLLDAGEISRLLQDINNAYESDGIPSFRTVIDRVNYKKTYEPLSSMTLSDGKVIHVNVNELVSVIKGLNYSSSYDRELFPGLSPEDFAGTEGVNLPSWNPFKLSKEGSRDRDDFTGTYIDRARFYGALIQRHYETLESIPEIYRENLFTEQADGSLLLNVEKFRRLLKGIDLLQQQVEDQVSAWIEGEGDQPGAVAELEDLGTQPMTVESMLKMYEGVVGLQQKIMDYLNSLTVRHEKEDVMAMEVALMKIYGKATRVMLDYFQKNQLTMDVDGVQVTIPVQQLNERLAAALAEKFPDEDDISAHHYAAFFGISIEDIRGYQKLAEFLGAQIIALPRNSQYVYVPAKLSGIGLTQLMQDAILRYKEDVVGADGSLDVDRLMQLLGDADLAVERANARADEIAAAALEKLNEIESPLNAEDLELLASLADDLRLELVNAMNDHVSGFTQEMFDAVQEHVRSTFEAFLEARINLVMSGSIRIQAYDGSAFDIDLSQLEGEAAARIVMILADLDAVELDSLDQQPENAGDTEVGDTGERQLKLEEVRLISLSPVYRTGYYPVKTVYYPYYNPIRVVINDEDKPTQFGFLTLLTRLATRYGSYVTDENGEFDTGRFLQALELTDAERAEEQFARLRDRALEELGALLPEEAEAAVSLETVVAIHNFLDAKREDILRVLYDLRDHVESTDYRSIVNAANAAWLAVIQKYESELFGRDLELVIEGTHVLVDVQAVAELLREEYNSGRRELLAPYLEGGEKQYEYDNFRILERNYYGGTSTQVTSENSEFLEDENDEEYNRYPFTFGDLRKIKGINDRDLSKIESAGSEVTLTLREAEELLKSRLNLRVFAPGSNVSTANIGAQAEAMSYSMAADVVSRGALSSVIRIEALLDPDYAARENMKQLILQPGYVPPVRTLDISERDLMYRVIPALVSDYFDELVKDGSVDLEALRELVRDGEEILREREKARILETLESQAEAFRKALESGNPELQTAGLTGLVEYENGRYYLKVYEPLLYRLIMTHTNAETGEISGEIAQAEGFSQLLAATGLSRDELLGKKGYEIYRLIPSIRYELPGYVYRYDADQVLLAEHVALDGTESEKTVLSKPYLNWSQYRGKYVTIDKARFSLDFKDGKVEGKVFAAGGVAGIQFAGEALNLLVSSAAARKAKVLRDAYLKQFVFQSEAREAKLIREGLASQILALIRALETGGPGAVSAIQAAGFVRRDEKGYFLEVPEPWQLVKYLLENRTETGLLKISAVTDELVEETSLSRGELVTLPVDSIIAYLPHTKYRLPADRYAGMPDIRKPAGDAVNIAGWERYLNQMVTLKGLNAYSLDERGRLEGSLNASVQDVRVLKHEAQAVTLLRTSAEAERAQNLREQLRRLLLPRPVIHHEEAVPAPVYWMLPSQPVEQFRSALTRAAVLVKTFIKGGNDSGEETSPGSPMVTTAPASGLAGAVATLISPLVTRIQVITAQIPVYRFFDSFRKSESLLEREKREKEAASV